MHRSNTTQTAAIIVVWATLVGAASLFCAWGVRELVLMSQQARHSYSAEYTDAVGRTHHVQADNLRELEDMLRALEARFPR